MITKSIHAPGEGHGRGYAPPQTQPDYFSTKSIKRASFDANQNTLVNGQPYTTGTCETKLVPGPPLPEGPRAGEGGVHQVGKDDLLLTFFHSVCRTNRHRLFCRKFKEAQARLYVECGVRAYKVTGRFSDDVFPTGLFPDDTNPIYVIVRLLTNAL